MLERITASNKKHFHICEDELYIHIKRKGGLVLPPVGKIRNRIGTIKNSFDLVQRKTTWKMVEKDQIIKMKDQTLVLGNWLRGIVIFLTLRQENPTLKHLYAYTSRHRTHSWHANGINHPPTQCRKIHCFLNNRQAPTCTKHRQWKNTLLKHLSAQIKKIISLKKISDSTCSVFAETETANF